MKELIFSKVAGLQQATLQKSELLHRYFSRILQKKEQLAGHRTIATSLKGTLRAQSIFQKVKWFAVANCF